MIRIFFKMVRIDFQMIGIFFKMVRIDFQMIRIYFKWFEFILNWLKSIFFQVLKFIMHSCDSISTDELLNRSCDAGHNTEMYLKLRKQQVEIDKWKFVLMDTVQMIEKIREMLKRLVINFDQEWPEKQHTRPILQWNCQTQHLPIDSTMRLWALIFIRFFDDSFCIEFLRVKSSCLF